MRTVVIAAAFAACVFGCSPATSLPDTGQQSALVLPASDPRAFADDIAARVANEGMAPISDVLRRMSPESLAQSQPVITTFEGAIGGDPALNWQRVEDVTLSGMLRRIYYIHVFEGTVLFTRFDFVNAGARGWYMSSIFFGSTWDNVSSGLTPSFIPTRSEAQAPQ